MPDVFIVALVGALISLDRTAFLQMMVSQPIVAGPIVGFVLGDPLTGLTIGCVLELFWIGALPVGGSIPPNETAAAVIATSVCIIACRDIGLTSALSLPIMIFSILVSIPLSIAGQRVDIFVRNYNRKFALNADELAGVGNFAHIDRENLKGLFSFFMASFFSLLALIGLGLPVVKTLYPLLSGSLRLVNGFYLSFYLFISLGIAVLMRTGKGKSMMPIFLAGFLIGLILHQFAFK